MRTESTRLPMKRWRTSSREMPTPKTVLMATEATATCAVSWSACTTSGSASASWMPVIPWAKVFLTRNQVGQTSSMKRYPTTTSRRSHLTTGEPVPTAVLVLATASHPPLHEVEDDDRQ